MVRLCFQMFPDLSGVLTICMKVKGGGSVGLNAGAERIMDGRERRRPPA